MPKFARLTLPLLALALALAAPVRAQAPVPQDAADHFGQHSALQQALQSVGLSDMQKQAVRQIIDSHQDELRGMFQSQRELRSALTRTDPRSSDYTAQIGDLAQQAAALAAQRVQLLARLKSEVYGTLTESQKTQLTAALAAAKPEPLPPAE